MKKLILLLTVVVLFSTKIFATQSIIMIDPNTNEIGIAGASCTYNCYGIGKILPGMGAIIVQAPLKLGPAPAATKDAENKKLQAHLSL